MLTSIDQPLDKLEDLTPEEMFVFLLLFSFANAEALNAGAILFFLSSEDMNLKRWIEYFTNKYIICGRLVENGAGET